MQVIERKRITPGNGFVCERRRRIWAGLLLVMAILVAVSSILGPSAALIMAGIVGAAVALAVVPSVRRVLWQMSPAAWRFVLLGWVVITLGLCSSFVISALSSHRVDAEARATIMALGLCAAWFAMMRMRHAGGAYMLAVTFALAEASRLIAFGVRPQPVSYFIWIAAAIVAWRTLTYRSSLSF